MEWRRPALSFFFLSFLRRGSLCEFSIPKMNLCSGYKLLSACISDHRKLLLGVERDTGVLLQPVCHFHGPASSTNEAQDYIGACEVCQLAASFSRPAFGQHPCAINLSFLVGGSKHGALYLFLFS